MTNPVPAVPAAPPAVPPNAPAATGGRKPQVRKPKVSHPSLIGPNDAQGNPQRLKLESVPGDFDHRKHSPLRKDDFTSEAVYYDMKATETFALAERFKRDAEMARKLGNSADRANARKLLAMQDKMAELTAQLTAAGIDVSELTGGTSEEAEEAEEVPEANPAAA